MARGLADWRADWLAIHLSLSAGRDWLATEADWLTSWLTPLAPTPAAHEILAKWEASLTQPGLARARECVPTKAKSMTSQNKSLL